MKFVSSLLNETDASVSFEYANNIIRRTRRRMLGEHSAILIKTAGDI